MLKFQGARIDPCCRSTVCNTPATVVGAQGSIEPELVVGQSHSMPPLPEIDSKLHRDPQPPGRELDPVLAAISLI